MMGQDKEEYEVGIPLDDLSSSAESVETETDEAENDDTAAGSEDEEGVGLPSLFDEEELAEVGLKAAPFGDDDDLPSENGDPEEAAKEHDEGIEVDESSEPISDESSEPISIDDALDNDLEDPEAIGELLSADSEPGEPDQANRATADTLEGTPMDGVQEQVLSQPDAAALQNELAMINTRLAELKDDFLGKLKYDAHKDKVIDKLHQELQEYKQDIVKKHILSIVLDVVKVADDIRKWLTYFRSLDVSQRDPVKLFRYLEAIPSDLEDIFYWQGVKPYSSNDDVFNPAKQRAIKKIPTGDPSKDKTIAKSLRPGYEWEDKVIRQEMVAVYVYEDEVESADTRNTDE
jgi:molecular chaperone GrpE (heat shock protein)